MLYSLISKPHVICFCTQFLNCKVTKVTCPLPKCGEILTQIPFICTKFVIYNILLLQKYVNK